MKISKAGIELIKSFEGCVLKAYKAHSSEKYYTIGYGHYGKDVTEDMKITKEEALKLLEKDLERYVDKVNKYLSIYSFNQNQFDALVSFCYNIGNIDGLTKKGTRTLEEISNSFCLYVKCNGVKLNGLVKRRESEKKLFDTKVSNSQSSSKYYPKCTIASTSIVDILKHISVNSDFNTRKKIAEANGISNYKGYSHQNTILVNLLKKGKLIRI